MLDSYFRPIAAINLPYQERQDYMHSFDIANPVMKEGFEDYLEPVQQLLKAADAKEGIAHMTVDEKIVLRGATQRRPFPHVDGQFIPSLGVWGHGGWMHKEELTRMPLILASSVQGCQAWVGNYDAEPKSDGDLSHISDVLGQPTLFEPNIGYLLSPDCIHESLPMDYTVARSLLRIALPIDFVV